MKTLLSTRTFFLFSLFLILGSARSMSATNYTWNGNTSSAWGTSTNWTPNGVPSSSDYIVIQTGTNALKLTSDKTIERYRINSGTMDLDGYTLTVNDQLLMYGGVTTAGKIVQNATNYTYINNATVNCKLNLVATTVTIRYSNMADSVKVKQTTTSGTIFWRGNRFFKHLDIENTSNGNMNIGNNPADSCFDGLTLTGKRIRWGYQYQNNYVQGDIVMNATGPSGTSVSVSSGGFGPSVYVDGNIILNKSGTGSCGFASVAGASSLTMTSGHSIIEGDDGFTEGEIIIKGLNQLGTGGGVYLNSGADAQILTMGPVDTRPNIGVLDIDLDVVNIDGAVVNGAASVTANEIAITNNTFNGPATLEHTGTVSSYNGGNVFNAPVSLTKSTASGNFLWGRTAVDTMMSTLQLDILNGGNLVMGYYHDVVLMGSLYCNEQSGSILLGDQWGGGFKIAGTGTQQLKLELGNSILSRNVTIDKPSGRLLLYDLMDVDQQQLTLTNGVLEVMEGGLVSIRDGATATGASDASFVQGPVKKIGNDGFTFPVGRNGIYQPLSMSAPSGSTYAFQAAYFDEDSDPLYDHSSKHASINYLDRTQYWTFEKLSGSRGVYLTLGWRDVDCGIASINDPDICSWGGTQWNNMGNDSPTGNTVTGTATTPKTTSDYGAYTWGNFSGISAQAGPDCIIVPGDTANIGIMEQPAWDYNWDPSATVQEPDSAKTRAYPTTKTEYVLKVTGENSCSAKDTMLVFITVMPEDTARSSLDFVVNQGQIIDTDGASRPDIGIYSHNASPMVYCGDNRVSFVHSKIDTTAATLDTLVRVDINFHETFRDAEPLGMGLNSHHYNYYYAHCPEGDTIVPSYKRVVYPLLYENTDLHIKGNNNWMKFEFVIHPGGDPEDILMTFEGADNVQVIQSLGLLIVTSSIGTYVFPKPKALKIDTVSGAVELGWQPDWDLSVTGDTVRFVNIGSYNPAEVLIFTLGEEPMAATTVGGGTNLRWSTYFGHSQYDFPISTVFGETNRITVVGYTESTQFPVSIGPYQSINLGGYDSFVSDFDDTGVLNWSTYCGGTENDNAQDVEPFIDVRDYVYVVGRTGSSNFPVTNVGSPGGYFDGASTSGGGYIQQYTFNGALSWSTFFGEGDAGIYSIAVDDADNIFVGGRGNNTNGDFPLEDLGGSALYHDDGRAFVAKFDPDHNLDWSTFLNSGESGHDRVYEMSIDQSNNLILIGNTGYESDPYFEFENQGSGFQDNTIGGTVDAFIAKFNSGGELYWSTYIGASNGEVGKSVATDSYGNIYACGFSTSFSGLPVYDAGGSSYFNDVDYQESWIAKFSPTGVQTWFTLLDGSAFHIDVKPDGELYVTGSTGSEDFPVHDRSSMYFQDESNNVYSSTNTNSYVFSLNPSLEPLWITYFGGTSNIISTRQDIAQGLDLSDDGSLLSIVGITTSNVYFPLEDPGNGAFFQPAIIFANPTSSGSSWDGFISVFDVSPNVSVPEHEIFSSEGIQVYPNPSFGEISILSNDKQRGTMKIDIYNSLGVKVADYSRESLPNQNVKITLPENIATGVYHFRITLNSEEFNTRLVYVSP